MSNILKVQKPPSYRSKRLASLITQNLGQILPNYLEDFSGLTTISRVEVSNDLKWAKIFLSIINSTDDLILKRLNHNIYEIQGRLNKTLAMKVFPKISFFLDLDSRHAARINQLLNSLDQ